MIRMHCLGHVFSPLALQCFTFWLILSVWLESVSGQSPFFPEFGQAYSVMFPASEASAEGNQGPSFFVTELWYLTLAGEQNPAAQNTIVHRRF